MTERTSYSDATIKQFHKLYETKMDLTLLAKLLEVTPQTLKNWFKSLGLTLHQQGGFNKGQRRVPTIPQEEYLSMTYEELAKKYLISKSTVRLRIKKYMPKGRGRKTKVQDPTPEE